MSNPLQPLGSLPRVTVTRVMRPQYRIEWEYDGTRYVHDYTTGDGEHVEARMRRVKYTAASRSTAYKIAARRIVYACALRRQLRQEEDGCTFCDSERGDRCRYHGGDGFDKIVARFARMLARRDAP